MQGSHRGAERGQRLGLVVVVGGYPVVGQGQQNEHGDPIADQLGDSRPEHGRVAALEQVADQHQHGLACG